VPQPDQVIRARPTPTSWELLVKWQGRNAAETSWEGLEQFKEAYPDFQLEDELFRQAGRSVMDTFLARDIPGRRRKVQLQDSRAN
jgi:hypothetical protein